MREKISYPIIFGFHPRKITSTEWLYLAPLGLFAHNTAERLYHGQINFFTFEEGFWDYVFHKHSTKVMLFQHNMSVDRLKVSTIIPYDARKNLIRVINFSIQLDH